MKIKMFDLPNTKINHFALKDNTLLLRLAEQSNCKFHNRIWRMRTFFLLARYAEKRIDIEKENEIVKKYLGKKFSDKIDLNMLSNLVKRPLLETEKQ